MTPEAEKALHEEVVATLDRLKDKHPELDGDLKKSYGYAVFPSIGRAALVIGGAYGRGEVYKKGKPIGFATLSQMTIGIQVGGQTMSEIILFEDRDALEAFKAGKLGFAANASAVILKATASGTTDYAKSTAHAYSRGGMLLEASLGGQKFSFIPPLGKGDKQDGKPRAAEGNGGFERANGGPGRSAGVAAGLTAAAALVTRLLVSQVGRKAARSS
jgi:hypothetical protein